MHDLPRYIEALANLRRDQEYGDLKKQLTTPAKAALLPVMAFRFWCHAHIYSLVFPLIIYDIIDDREKEALSHLAHYLPQTLGQSWLPLFKITLTLLIVALGSLSFAFFDLLGGVIADKNGCKPAILFGLLGMIVLMLFFAGTTYFSTGKTALILLMVGQIFVGLPLALIDNADTVLTDKIATAQGLNQSDEKYLEGICVKLKYSGLAVASTIGCFLYMFAGPMLKKNGASTGAFIFLITAALQGLAIWKLKLVGEPDSESTELVSKGLLIRFRDAAASVYAERVLGIWVLISAITEGWLLFAAVYFQFGALANLRASAGSSRILLLMIPLAYYLVSRLASEGGGHFNRWLKARLAKDTNTAFRLRHGSILETSRVRLVAAITILAVMSAVFVGHLIVTMVFTESVLNSNYILSLLSLVFYGVYQFIRGFSSPLLRTTLKNHAKEKSISDLTATLSFATGVGRLFHALVTLLFTICLILVIVQSPGKDNPASSLKNGIPDAIKALAATIVVTVLVIVVLNFLANILLDRKKKHSSAFDLEDFKNVTGLIKKLNEPEAPLAVYLRSQFSPLTRNLLEQARTSERPSEALKEALVDELNRIIVSPGLYDRDRFAEVRLTAATKASIEQSLQDEDLARQNRVLLEEAYPAEIEQLETTVRPLLKEIPIAFGTQSFRSTLIKGAFFVCLALSNILAPKLAGLSFLVFNCGALAYALSFMLVDTVAETEGRAASRRLWLAGLCTYLIVGLLVAFAVRLPGRENKDLNQQFASSYQGCMNEDCVKQDCKSPEYSKERCLEFTPAFNMMFSNVRWFVFASFCSFTVSQYLDIWFFLFLKRVFKRRMLALRSNLTTFIAQTVDTMIFIGIGFGYHGLATFSNLVLGQLGMKWIFSLLSTPVLVAAVWWIESGKVSPHGRSSN